jgi:predicted dehydrogenase
VAVTATVDRRGHDVDVNSALTVTLAPRSDDARSGELGSPAPITASVGVSGAGVSIPDPGESLRIWGTDGTVAFDGETITVREAGVTYESTPAVPDFETLTRRKLRNVVDAVAGEADLEIPATDARRVVALTESAYAAAERGERVSVPRPDAPSTPAGDADSGPTATGSDARTHPVGDGATTDADAETDTDADSETDTDADAED